MIALYADRYTVAQSRFAGQNKKKGQASGAVERSKYFCVGIVEISASRVFVDFIEMRNFNDLLFTFHHDDGFVLL